MVGPRQPIRLSANFHDLDTRTFTEYEWFPYRFATGVAGKAYPSGHLVPFPFLGLVYAPIDETSFTELAIYFSRLFSLNTPWYFLDFAHFISETA